MHELPKDIVRQVVPRWRSLARTRAAELASVSPGDAAWRATLIAEREKRIERTNVAWKSNPTLVTASEFVAAAIRSIREQEAVGAARQVLARGSTATEATKSIAARLLEGDAAHQPQSDTEELTTDQIRQKIAGVKRRIVTYPRNPFLLVEGARLYSLIGQEEKANDALQRAIALAPNSRFVLRSAARFFVHADAAKEAHRHLSLSEMTPNDPWLIAAEIALAHVSGQPPKFVSKARDFLRLDKLPPIQLTEMAAALGTLELENGARRQGMRLVRQSLQDPTDNSVAQAQWAAAHTGSEFNTNYLRVQGTFEARAENAHLSGGAAEEIVENCRLWWEDEPFSSRPALLGSYVASSRLNDFMRALQFTDAGLIANPDSVPLKNNKIVALAKLGRVEAARFELNRLLVHQTIFNPILRATEGLVNFREKNIELGRQCYKEAIVGALANKNRDVATRARIHFIEEELAAGNVPALQDLGQLRQDVLKSKNLPLLALWDDIEGRLTPSINGKRQS